MPIYGFPVLQGAHTSGDTSIEMANLDAAPNVGSTFTLDTNKYYSVELYAKIDSINGEFKVYADGSEVISVTGINNSNFGNISRIFSGAGTGHDEWMAVYIDDVVVSRNYIWP